MIRTKLAQAYIKRTLRVNYGWTQATPKSCFLDPNWDRSVPIWPGMAMARTSGPNYTLCGAGMSPAGLAGLYVGGDGIDEPGDAGINAFAVWVLDPDAEFEVLAPAFDASLTWTDTGGAAEEFGGEAITTGLEPVNQPEGTGYPTPTTYTEAGTAGQVALVYARTANASPAGLNGLGGPLGTTGLRGQLVPAGTTGASTQPVARLLAVNSPTSITIGGLYGTA